MAPCCQSFGREFRLNNFLLKFNNRKCFSTPQWAISQLLFVAYRVAVTVLMIGWPLVDLLTEARRFYGSNYALWFVFATNWSLLLLALCVLMQAAAASLHLYRTLKRSEDEMSQLTVAVYGIVYIATANSSVVVSLTYWAYVFYADGADYFLTPMSQVKHTFNSLYIFADLLICAMPIRLFHFVYPFLLGIAYATFNVTYFVNDGVGPEGERFSYKEMDWHRNPVQSIFFTICVFSMVIVAQLILYGVFQLRLLLVNLCGGKSVASDSSTVKSCDSEDPCEIQPITNGDFVKQDTKLSSFVTPRREVLTSSEGDERTAPNERTALNGLVEEV